jgi:hypothetical protein
MNPIAEEIFSCMTDVHDENELYHYGMPRRSGRYPWGSGDDPYQRNRDLLGRYADYKKQGLSEVEIAREMQMLNKKGEPSTEKLRVELRYAKDERKLYDIARAKSLAADGLGPSEIGRQMGGVSESTIRGWLKEGSEQNISRARNTANIIKAEIDKKGMIDVGPGVERELKVSEGVLKEALYILDKEGYPTYSGRMPQVTNAGKHTTLKVICPPGTEHKEIYDYGNINSLKDYQPVPDSDRPSKFVYPSSLDSSRLKIRYAEEGGIEKDGIVELRRGVDDISLGGDHYAQVRILVDKTHYIKGMAVYSDDMPDGVDVIFNTNKSNKLDKKDVLKKIKDDPDNPFGSLIKEGGQSYYTDKDGKQQLSLINKRASEGDWTEWADALPSQFLGKQSQALAKKQLALAKADKLAEFDEICSLNNPVIKKHYLKEFADNCDAAAVHLKAAALPGQKYHVIIPVNSLKDTEIYAPGYESGTKLALVRYPHGGIFEIPVLTVNNKHAAARKIIGDGSIDAVGINKNIADRLSGADFDGDTVMCIPTDDAGGKVRIQRSPGLKELEGFDPKVEYGPDTYKGREIKPMKRTDLEMGKISNLITDMTLLGADSHELARAVRHSMVVIDAEKHKLDYKKSEVDHNIQALKKAYQIKIDKNGNVRYGGASTILSRAKGEYEVVKRQGTPKVNQKGKPWYDPDRPEGAYIYRDADDAEYTTTSIDKRTGAVKTTTNIKKQKSTRMAETDDAYTLVSTKKHPMEVIYAEYANSMKNLANQARLEYVRPEKIKYSSSAKQTYRTEVDALSDKLNDALLNSPRERQAQRLANAALKEKKLANPNLKKDEIKKAGQQALSAKRLEVGATARKKRNIDITDREWEAIQAGAISENVLKKILMNTDPDKLRERAMPRTTTTLSPAKVNKIKSMSSSNYTIDQIAKSLGVSKSTVSKYLKGVN